jgi:uncharacterized YccA/Bax inhibitor family protein
VINGQRKSSSKERSNAGAVLGETILSKLRMAMYRYHGEKISVREIFTSTMLLIEILLLLLINLIFNFFFH